MSNLGDVIATARRARGLTQERLAETATITQAALSRYEADLRQPDEGTIARIAAAVGVTPELLKHGGALEGAVAVDAHLRRRATARATVWRRLEAELNLRRVQIALLAKSVDIDPPNAFPSFDLDRSDPADAARLLRMQWRMPIGPVRSLIGWMESAGCFVIDVSFGTTRVDALSQWIGGNPVVLLNSDMPTDRRRMTLAHELGHLVLHHEYFGDDPEYEANAFAAEFLMPADVIRPQLRRISVGRLHDLKREWMVSFQALVERAHGLGTLTAADRTSMYRTIGARGWRQREPISSELPPEVASTPLAITLALRNRGLGDSEIAYLAGFASVAEATRLLQLNLQLRVVKGTGE